MVETAARLLRLLTLLQTRPGWTGAALAMELGVSGRTIRNDIERLRALGYPVWGTRGEAGGYRLGAGTALPPLLLDDAEAVAVAVGLYLAAGNPIAGIDAAAAGALTKLRQVLPDRLRQQVASLQASLAPSAATAAAPAATPEPAPMVDPDTLLQIATLIRERRTLRFDYRSHAGMSSRREAEALQMVHTRHRWYLVAWDTQRAAWRTFRVDRLRPRFPPGPSFPPREPPPGGAAAFLDDSLHTAVMQFRATLRVHAPAATLAPVLPPAVLMTPESDHTCLVRAGAESPAALAVELAQVDEPFEVLDSPELVAAIAALIARFQQAIGAAPT